MNPLFRSPKFIIAAIAIIIGIAGFLMPKLLNKPSIPDFTVTQLDGTAFNRSMLSGKVGIINFWATSCSSCIKEMPQLTETYLKFQGKNLEMIAIAMSYDPPDFVKNFTESRKLPFKVALDRDGRAAQSFGPVQLTPTTVLIDKKGYIIKQYVGEPDWASFHQLIENALQESI